MKKIRKGFTIVELVIVIAVIAVLTAVLVPTFIHLSNKAKKASDQSLVNNLNTALKMEYAEKGKKPETMYDAVKSLENQGYIADQLVAKSEQDLVYNIELNEFALTGSKDSQGIAIVEGPSWWKIYNAESEISGKWSVYANEGFVVSGEKVEVSTGFDVGRNSDISVAYSSSLGQSVLIRTNGGALTIDASADTVKHYGEGAVLTIEAIAGSSYHECGYFPKATVKQGRVVVENSGQIQVIDASGATAAVSVEKTGTGEVNNVIKGENSNVSVASDLTEKIATIATATTWADLKTQVESGSDKVIKFEPTADLTGASCITVARDVTVLGNGRHVSGTIVREGVSYNWQYNGLFNIAGHGITVGLDSMNLESLRNSDGSSRCAVNLVGRENNITISNSTLTAQYAICTNQTGADGNKLTLNGLKFGSNTYCSLYWRASGGSIVANHTIFSSVNTANNSQSNGFGTIVVEFAKKAGVHSQVVDNLMQNNTFTLNNCSITKLELGDAIQCVVAVYSPYNNVVNLNNCDYDAKNDLIVLAKAHVWDPAANSSTLVTTEYELDRPEKASRLYIDGVAADGNLNVLHSATRDCCIPIIGGTTNTAFANDGCDYKALKNYTRVDNGNGTWTYRRA